MISKEKLKHEEWNFNGMKGFRTSNLITSLKSKIAMVACSILATTVVAQSRVDVDTPVPKQENLSMIYTVDPYTVSEAAKAGKFPLFPLADGSLGIPVMPLSEMSDNTPKEFFDYTKYYFNSGVAKDEDGERDYAGYANVHVAIAVNPDDPVSVAKIKKLNEFLTDKIKGDPENGVFGWAEKYGLAIDAIVPIYIDDKKSVPLKDAYYGVLDLTLKPNDVLATVNDHVVFLDINNQGFQDPNRLVLLLEDQLDKGAYYYTRYDYEQKINHDK